MKRCGNRTYLTLLFSLPRPRWPKFVRRWQTERDLEIAEQHSFDDMSDDRNASCPKKPAAAKSESEETRDVCGIAQFTSYDEADEHESTCSQKPFSSNPVLISPPREVEDENAEGVGVSPGDSDKKRKAKGALSKKGSSTDKTAAAALARRSSRKRMAGASTETDSEEVRGRSRSRRRGRARKTVDYSEMNIDDDGNEMNGTGRKQKQSKKSSKSSKKKKEDESSIDDEAATRKGDPKRVQEQVSDPTRTITMYAKFAIH